jgi:hypothetical protein
MAIKANLVIDQGSSFSATIDVANGDGTVFNLTGYTVAAQMRKNYTSSVAVTFSSTHNGVGGGITLSLLPAQTATIEPGRYLYDVEITSSGGSITRVVEGMVTVTPGMTRI